MGYSKIYEIEHHHKMSAVRCMYCGDGTCQICLALREAPEATRAAVLRAVNVQMATSCQLINYEASHNNGDLRVGGIRELQLELYGVLKGAVGRVGNCEVYAAYQLRCLREMKDYLSSATAGVSVPVHIPSTEEHDVEYVSRGWRSGELELVRKYQYISPVSTMWAKFQKGGLMEAFAFLYEVADGAKRDGVHLGANLTGTWFLQLYKFPDDVCVLYIYSDVHE